MYIKFGLVIYTNISILRKITPYEIITLGASNWIQLAIKLTDTRLIPPIIDMLNNEVIGLHLRVENNNLIYDPKARVIIKEPKIQSTSSLERACKYCYEKKIDESKRLGEISYYGNNIILNICHICGDGRFLTKQLENIININSYNFKSKAKNMLTPFEDCFKNQLSRIKPKKENVHFDRNASRILTKNHKAEHDVYYHYDCISFPANELKIYNKETKKISGFNEELHTAFILTSLAFSNKIKNKNSIWFKSFGTCSCIDLKKKGRTKRGNSL